MRPTARALPGQDGLAQLLGGAGPGRGNLQFQQVRAAALLGQRDQAFAITVVVLSAKLAKCDGVVSRAEIDAFKRAFRIPPGQVAQVGRVFDQARATTPRATNPMPPSWASCSPTIGRCWRTCWPRCSPSPGPMAR